MDEQRRKAAAEYHRSFPRVKISVRPTTGLANQRDLALAYSPGVTAACELIVSDPTEACTMTSRDHLVAVLTNGTAMLGIGSIGALARKPVMEGKGYLFEKFAGIDVFNIEINEIDPDIPALTNQPPEILPEAEKTVQPDAIITTGRPDYSIRTAALA